MSQPIIELQGTLRVCTPVSSHSISNPSDNELLTEAMKAVMVNQGEAKLHQMIMRIIADLGPSFRQRVLQEFQPVTYHCEDCEAEIDEVQHDQCWGYCSACYQNLL